MTLDDARPLDTKRYLVLFDGLRAHTVTPFDGERYSLVFFSVNHYDRARSTVVKALVGSGAQWPNYTSLKYYALLIGPPKGYVAPSQSILRFLGRLEREPVLKWIGRTLLTLGDDIVADALSYLLRPRDMPDVCAVCRGLAGAAWASNAWSGSVVDTAAIKPLGVRAKRHYTLWGRARIIIGGRWQFGVVSLLLSHRFALWRWQELGGSPFLAVESCCVMVSQSPVPPKVTMIFDKISNDVHRGVTVGFASTRDVAGIVAAIVGKSAVQFCRTKFTKRCRQPLSSLSGPKTFSLCDGGGGIPLRGQFNDANTPFVAVVFHQTAKPSGRVVPCWTIRPGAEW